jgi:hypothetical protein
MIATRKQLSWLLSLLLRITKPRSVERVSDWCAANLRFNEPECTGPFSFAGREYLREPLDNWGEDGVTDQTTCWGTRLGKTRVLYGGLAWTLANQNVRALYVKPKAKGTAGAEDDARTRFIPMIRSTQKLAALIPAGNRRHDFKTAQQILGGSIVDWTGSNAVSSLASNPCRVVIQDECDKFGTTRKRDEDGNVVEADASSLADERCKEFSNPKRFKASTPTRTSGLIWQSLLKSDLRRYFVPCPHCNPEAINVADAKTGWVVFAWSKEYTMLALTGCEAWVKWDQSAKGVDGEWDYKKVESTAHAECPHCRGVILDTHKGWMVEHGHWRATQVGLPGHRGYHLPSMYAAHQQCNFGKMAVRFLKAVDSVDGPRGFINSDLAEVHANQEQGSNRIEISTRPLAQVDWVAQLTGDYQKNWPYLWFVVRKWCAFKLLPPFDPKELIMALNRPENETAKLLCDKLVAGQGVTWPAVAELVRFDSRTGKSPVVEFLITQGIVGEKLLKLFVEDAKSDTMEFRRVIYRELSLHESGGKDPVLIKAPRGGDSELIAAGHCALSGEYVWDELKDIAKQFEIGKGMTIPNRCVAVDCGYAEKFNREVLRKCHESASEYKFYDPMSNNRPAVFYQNPIHRYCLPCARDGWFAIKGYPMNKRWTHGGMKNEFNVNIEDPFYGTQGAGTAVVEVLEIPSGLFWIRKDELRRKRRNFAYSVSPRVEWFPKITHPDGTVGERSNFKLEDYERQLNEQFYDDRNAQVKTRHGRGGSQSRAHPYHLDDCETYQVALAMYNEFFETETTKPK